MNLQFLTDAKGRKIAAIVPIEEYAELMEDLEDLASIAKQRDEKGISYEEVMKGLKLRIAEDAPLRN
jgi:hypothetical protein